MYIKAFTRNLTGHSGYPYAVGLTYTAGTTDAWHWLHYAKKAREAVKHYAAPDTRFCEVKPLGETRHWKAEDLDYWATNKLQIIRELDRSEVYELLLSEGCHISYLIKLHAPFGILKRSAEAKKHHKYSGAIKGANYLTAEEISALLTLQRRLVTNGTKY